MEDVKPEGPIFIDLSECLRALPIDDVVRLCNTALNSMSLSQFGEVVHNAGLRVKFDLVEKD